uniref:Uncharacterized protein n=1 Tax=Grammatophora oceanica TaxID=210454 RepID=A0A7S1Y439_9STRA
MRKLLCCCTHNDNEELRSCRPCAHKNEDYCSNRNQNTKSCGEEGDDEMTRMSGRSRAREHLLRFLAEGRSYGWSRMLNFARKRWVCLGNATMIKFNAELCDIAITPSNE